MSFREVAFDAWSSVFEVHFLRYPLGEMHRLFEIQVLLWVTSAKRREELTTVVNYLGCVAHNACLS